MNAVIYARYSSDSQREESITAQIRACSNYAENNGINVVHTYTDEALSARSDNRPQFLRMVKDAESKTFDAVIVHKLDRFSRDRYDAMFYRRSLKKNGISVISVLEHIDGSPESVIMESLIDGMAEYYSKNLAREVLKGMKENALSARPNGGRPPLGYVVVDGKYAINEYEAMIVKELFQLVLSGTGYRKIAEIFNAKGYRTNRGSTFKHSSFHDYLKNEKYIGTYSYFVTNKKGSVGHDEGPIILKDSIPAIIDKDDFYSVQKMMSGRKWSRLGGASKMDYLLSGKIFCGKCDGRMTGANRNGVRVYQCANKRERKTCDKKEVSADLIEDAVFTKIEELFTDEYIDEMTDKIMVIMKQQAYDPSGIDEELKKLNKEIENTLQYVREGTATKKMIAMLAESEERFDALSEEKENSKSQIQFTREQIKMFLSEAQKISGNTIEEKKILVKTFIDKVHVFDDGITIDFIIGNVRTAGFGSPAPTVLTYSVWIGRKKHILK